MLTDALTTALTRADSPALEAGGSRPDPEDFLTPRQADALDELLATDSPRGPPSGIFAGDPGTGKTRVLAALASRRRDTTVVVAHFTAVAHWKSTLERAGVPVVIAVQRRADLRALRAAIHASPGPWHAAVVCTDTILDCAAAFLDGMREPPARLIVDNVESVHVPRFNIASRRALFVTGNLPAVLRDRRRCRDRLSRRLLEAASAGSRVVLRQTLAGFFEDRTILYREHSQFVAIETVARLMALGETSIAAACMPGDRLSTADAQGSLQQAARDRLADDCPICFEARRELPRVLLPCCTQNLCLECFATTMTYCSGCPMCRASVQPARCTLVDDPPPALFGTDTEQISSILRNSLTSSPLSRVLVVAGPTQFGDVYLDVVMSICRVPYVPLRGNGDALRKRLRIFQRSGQRVAGIAANTLRLAPLRLGVLTHVVLIGTFSNAERTHWAARAAGPDRAPAKVYAVQSALDRILNPIL